jgi:hypothetical protein
MCYALIGLIHFLLFLIAAAEILTSRHGVAYKLVWLLVIFLLPVVGLVLYFVTGRDQSSATS